MVETKYLCAFKNFKIDDAIHVIHSNREVDIAYVTEDGLKYHNDDSLFYIGEYEGPDSDEDESEGPDFDDID